MIVSSWDRIQDLPHEAGKFTHWATMNIHPFSYKKALFNMPYGITCSLVMIDHVYDDYVMQLHVHVATSAALWSRSRKTLGHGSLVYAIPGSV